MISQIELLGAIFLELDRQGVKSLAPRATNAIIAAANDIIAQCEREPVMASEGMGLKRWLASDDTGASSCYMAGVLGGFDRPYGHPYDLDDFGRCMRLLEAVPEFRHLLDRMKPTSAEWANLVDSWDAIADLFHRNDWKPAYKLLRSCIELNPSAHGNPFKQKQAIEGASG